MPTLINPGGTHSLKKPMHLNPRRCAYGVACYGEVLDASTSELLVLPDKRIGRVCPSCATLVKTR